MTFIDYSRNEREWRSIDHRGEPIIKLPRGKNSVRFHFNNRSLVSRKVEYKYKLEGFQKVWNDLPEGNSVTFADLKPGKYRLLLTGSNDGVNWHSMHHSPLIIRQPLVWEQKFFSILITAAVLGFIYLLAHYFIRRRQEAEIRALNQKKRMNELMLQTIRTKNIPHFSGNALSRIESFIFNSDFRQANKFLSLYSKLINTTLSDSDRPSRTIREEIEYVKIYMDLEKIRSDGRFDYEINVLPEVDMQVEIPNMLLHTWSENAIKHGIWESKRKGLINIQIFQESDILTVKVTDNGIGREKAREMHTQGSGNGLRIIKEQLEVYNRFNKEKAYIVVDDLKDSEGNPMGTSFSLRMPLTYQFSF